MTPAAAKENRSRKADVAYTAVMRKFVYVAFFLMVSLPFASAQQPSPEMGPRWSRLEDLPPGMDIHVKSRGAAVNCALKSADETMLTCANGDGTLRNFPRAEIKAVQIRHRGRSTLAGLAIGIGAGAAIGAPLGRSGSFVGHGAAALIFAVPGAVIGTIVGATTDFTHSTVYRAH